MADKANVLTGAGAEVAEEEATGTEGEAAGLDREARFHEPDELRTLIAEGREHGYLTFEQIAATLEEVEVTKEQVLQLHTYLVDQGIEILGSDGKPVTVDARLTADTTDTDRAAR